MSVDFDVLLKMMHVFMTEVVNDGVFEMWSIVGVLSDPVCLTCRQVVEDLDNVFLHCLFAIIIWKDVGIVPGIWFYQNVAIWKQKIMIANHLMHYVDEFL
ncbi:hypothetical protein Gohar_020533 [Gossypium harknessii]|uniref:Reverse transcriptase zinc-binding domain-containing protein n=1 Tax=Gossypium harknessii TaxID=34285 RepID=A0A7J9HYI5_9ROSI|nr:hypothetical protein [Gossypium harknessii]